MAIPMTAKGSWPGPIPMTNQVRRDDFGEIKEGFGRSRHAGRGSQDELKMEGRLEEDFFKVLEAGVHHSHLENLESRFHPFFQASLGQGFQELRRI